MSIPKITAGLSRRLSRVTSSGFFLPQLDGLRFVAVMAVILFHLSIYVSTATGTSGSGTFLGHFCNKGDLGVQLFFAISGFILAIPFAAHCLEGRNPVNLRHYFARRVTRLEPPYLANLLLIFALLVVVEHRRVSDLLPNLLASSTYLSYLTMGHPSEINGVAWSLEVEVQFYVLTPLLALLFRIANPWARRGAICALGVLSIIAQAAGLTEKTILGNLQYFMVGYLLADIYLTDWKRAPRRDWRWDAAALCAWVSMDAIHAFTGISNALMPAAIYVAYAGAFRGVLFPRIFSHRFIVIVGGMCYTIYLYHYFFISAVGRLTVRLVPTGDYTMNMLIQFALVVPVVLAGSAILFALLERPFMDRRWPGRILAMMGVRSNDAASGAPVELPGKGLA